MKNKAIVQIRLGHYTEAMKSLEQAIKLFDALSPELLIERSVRESRGKTLDNLGWMHLIHGRATEAEPRVRDGLAVRESLLADAPDSSEYQDDLGLSKSHLGEILRRQGALAQARRCTSKPSRSGKRRCKAIRATENFTIT